MIRTRIIGIRMFLGLPDLHPDLIDRGTNPRIRIRIGIRTKMSRIHSTALPLCNDNCNMQGTYRYLGEWYFTLLFIMHKVNARLCPQESVTSYRWGAAVEVNPPPPPPKLTVASVPSSSQMIDSTRSSTLVPSPISRTNHFQVFLWQKIFLKILKSAQKGTLLRVSLLYN